MDDKRETAPNIKESDSLRSNKKSCLEREYTFEIHIETKVVASYRERQPVVTNKPLKERHTVPK